MNRIFLLLLIVGISIKQMECQEGILQNRLCHVQNCINCQLQNLNICRQCSQGYSGADCKKIQCSIDHCSTGCYLPNKCGECQPGFAGSNCWPIDCSKVKHCSYGCTSPNICGRCDHGYSGNSCQIANCKISNCKAGCKQPNICSSCDIGFMGADCSIKMQIQSSDKQSLKASQSLPVSDSSQLNSSNQSSKTTGLTIGLVIVSILLFITLIGLVYSIRKLKVKKSNQELNSQKQKKGNEIPPSSTGMINANEFIQ